MVSKSDESKKKLDRKRQTDRQQEREKEWEREREMGEPAKKMKGKTVRVKEMKKLTKEQILTEGDRRTMRMAQRESASDKGKDKDRDYEVQR